MKGLRAHPSLSLLLAPVVAIASATLHVAWAVPQEDPVEAVPGGTNPLWEIYDIENLEPGQKPVVKLPLTFIVAPDCRLYCNGRRIYEATLAIDATVEFHSEGALTLNGIPIFPHRPKPPKTLSEQTYRDLYGEVPFVLERVAQGRSWSEAAEDYLSVRNRFVRAL